MCSLMTSHETWDEVLSLVFVFRSAEPLTPALSPEGRGSERVAEQWH